MTGRPSLLERAAEIYDFASGLPMAEPVAAPPQVRAPAPEAPVAAPASLAPRVAPRPAPRPVHAPAAHGRIAVDHDAMSEAGLLSPDAQGGALSEEMRLIKRRLLSAVDGRAGEGDERARLVLIASGRPGEGKTFLTLNLALSIAAEPERSVLLVDGDNAKPELLARLGVDETPAGLADALADERLDPEALVLETDIERLSILPAGRKERNLPELLASARTGFLLNRLLAADPRRIILIDSTPVLAASTATVLAEHVGQALVVVKADATHEADLKETLDLLSACDYLSLALNGAAFQVRGRRSEQYEEYR